MTTIAHRAPCARPAGSALRLHLFGGPYLTVGGTTRPVPEGGKRLLAFVALHHDRLDRGYVAGALWPSGGDGRAAGNLRSALWRLRSAGIDVLTADKLSVHVSAGVAVDVREIGDWAMRLITDTATEADLAVPACCPEALDMLPGWYDDWALAERERLRFRMLHALEALGRRLVGLGRFAEAVEVALLAVSAEPLRESAQRVLIEAHLMERNWVEAHRAFEAYRSRLLDELDVAPSAELAALLRSARTNLSGQVPGQPTPLRRSSAGVAPTAVATIAASSGDGYRPSSRRTRSR